MVTTHSITGNTQLEALHEHRVVRMLGDLFHANGHQLLLVGGSVRDGLTGTPCKDLDFTTDADVVTMRRLLEPLGSIWDAGAAFGTLGVALDGEVVEITSFRDEIYDDTSRKPQVTTCATLEDDLRRRDLTINAIAMDVTGTQGYLIDPFGGVDDLARGVLRTPGDPMVTMSEDPLRQVRVVRFAARTGFTVDPSLAAAILATRDRLSIVARERITGELTKLIDGGPQMLATALRLEDELGLHGTLLGAAQRIDTIEHLDATPHSAAPGTVLAVIAVPLGPTAEKYLQRLRLPSNLIARAIVLARAAQALVGADEVTQYRVIARHVTLDNVELDAVAAVAAARGHDVTSVVDAVRAVIATEPAVTAALPIDGHDLLAAGLVGRQIGHGLRAATYALYEHGTVDRDTAMHAALTSVTTRI